MIRTTAVCKLTETPEVRATRNGGDMAFARAEVDTGRQWPLRLKLMAFGETARALAALPEGAVIIAEGRPEAEGYIGKQDGQPKGALKLVVDGFQHVGGDSTATDPPATYETPQSAPERETDHFPAGDDLPF